MNIIYYFKIVYFSNKFSYPTILNNIESSLYKYTIIYE